MALARYLVLQAVKGGKIRGRGAHRAAGISGAEAAADCRFPTLILDCPEIARLDIHPVLASGNEFTCWTFRCSSSAALASMRQHGRNCPQGSPSIPYFANKDAIIEEIVNRIITSRCSAWKTLAITSN